MVGDVFRAPYPFADSDEFKARPVVVVADAREGNQMDWVVCSVTTQEPGSLAAAISIVQADFQEGSLPQDSWVRPNRIFTLNDSLLTDRRGRLTDGKIAEIRAAARALFDAGGSAPAAL